MPTSLSSRRRSRRCPNRSLPPWARAAESCTVTDVGSTKRGVCAAVADRGRFIGGHPICGSEAHGPEHASGQLFEGATWFLTPVPETDRGALPHAARLRHVARRGAGRGGPARARPARRADEPRPARARERAREPGRLGAGRRARAARGRRRIAARHDARRGREPADLGGHLPGERRRAALGVSGSTGGASRSSSGRSRETDAGYLARWIAEAAQHRRQLLAESYPDPGSLQWLRVHVPDRPGVLSGITQALGAEGSTSRTSTSST